MDSSITLIENVPVTIDMAAAAKKLGIKPGQTKFEKTLERLAGIVLEKARPRAVARLCTIKPIDENNVDVEGVRITSPLLREKTEGLSRVFTFVSTEGLELAKWADHLESSLELVFTGILREFVEFHISDIARQHTAIRHIGQFDFGTCDCLLKCLAVAFKL